MLCLQSIAYQDRMQRAGAEDHGRAGNESEIDTTRQGDFDILTLTSTVLSHW